MKKLLAAVLAGLVLCGGVAISMITVSAADIQVVIAQTDTVDDIHYKIADAIGEAAPSDTVTVSGSKTDATEGLLISIPSGVKVIWTATYEGDADKGLIRFSGGEGIFEVTTGGSIIATGDYAFAIVSDGDDECDVAVTGGTIEAAGKYGNCAIDNLGDITITGGTVKARGERSSCAISSSNVTVTGGTIEAVGGSGYSYAIQSSGDVIVTGGTVKATGDSGYAFAIFCDGDVIVNDGTIEATVDSGYGYAIDCNFGNVTINGGKVEAIVNFGYGFAIDCYSGNVTINSGMVEATVNSGYVLTIRCDSGTVTISGGTIEAPEDFVDAVENFSDTVIAASDIMKAASIGNNAIFADSSAAAYLAGTCTGAVTAMNGSLIVEVDTLAVPKSRNATSAGLTVKAGAGKALWDCTGAKPVIKFTIGKATKTMEWGSYSTAPTTTTKPATTTTTKPATTTTTKPATTTTTKPATTTTTKPATTTTTKPATTTTKPSSSTTSTTSTTSATTQATTARPPNTIFSTGRKATFLNWFLFIVAFGWIWMRF